MGQELAVRPSLCRVFLEAFPEEVSKLGRPAAWGLEAGRGAVHDDAEDAHVELPALLVRLCGVGELQDRGAKRPHVSVVVIGAVRVAVLRRDDLRRHPVGGPHKGPPGRPVGRHAAADAKVDYLDCAVTLHKYVGPLDIPVKIPDGEHVLKPKKGVPAHDLKLFLVEGTLEIDVDVGCGPTVAELHGYDENVPVDEPAVEILDDVGVDAFAHYFELDGEIFDFLVFFELDDLHGNVLGLLERVARCRCGFVDTPV